MKRIIGFLLFYGALTCQGQLSNYYMLTGTYTTGKSQGIYVYKVNVNNARVDSVSMIKTPDPSYLITNDQRLNGSDHAYVYAVNEVADSGHGGTVSAFELDRKNGTLRFINKRSTGGDHPCHISIDRSGRWIAVSNYTSGSFSILPLQKDGSIDSSTIVVRHTGSSVNIERQKSAHAHCALFAKDNKYLLVADLGIDKVIVYPFDQRTGKVDQSNVQFINSIPGSGPRQIIFDNPGKHAYVIEELTGHISVYRFSGGKLVFTQHISTLPKGFTGFAGSADIHISSDGKFLYASNRGESNTLAIYKIGETGLLTLVGHQPTLGIAPRYFSLTPGRAGYLMVANKDSDEILVFKRDVESGLMKDTGIMIHVGNPVCLGWVQVR